MKLIYCSQYSTRTAHEGHYNEGNGYVHTHLPVLTNVKPNSPRIEDGITNCRFKESKLGQKYCAERCSVKCCGGRA